MRPLHQLCVAEKLLHSGFIVLVCFGLLSAELYLYSTHTGLDGRGGVTLKDIEISYYGKRDSSKLQSVLPVMLANAGIAKAQWPEARAEFDHWIAGGQSRVEYERRIKPFVAEHCLMCHSAAMSRQLHNPPLVAYDDVKAVARVDTGMAYTTMFMNGMVHLTTLALIFWLAGYLFMRTRMIAPIKVLAVSTPFVAQLLDFFGWFLTHHSPGFAWIVLIGGALSCPIAALELLASFFDMWWPA
ncbi:hypothetical protein GALL_397520 [mine drainage metagenome]|uniref:Elongation factor-1 alpha n=1 Tax=mine drainage metagenome TaxID=410659 RepID=A0A1J5QEX3_9ZZZZ